MNKFGLLIPGVFLGWSLGSNDAANVFGTAVATGAVKFRIATILASIFIILGAVLEGPKCMETVGGMVELSLLSVFIAPLMAALTVLFMTYLALPVSTSQAIMGAVIGSGLAIGNPVDWAKFFGKVFPSWVLTPVGAAVFAALFYITLGKLIERVARGLAVFHTVVRWGLIIAGVAGSYSLGANNVANTTGVFVGAKIMTPFTAALVGGIAIATGVLTYSRRVMETVGKGITPLDPFTGLIVVLAESLTIWVYTQIGVPVSTSQAVVGAVAGIGMVKGIRTVKFSTLGFIALGWVSTPLVSGILAFVTIKVINLLF